MSSSGDYEVGDKVLYQGNLVEVVENNGCLITVKLVDEPETRPFTVHWTSVRPLGHGM